MLRSENLKNDLTNFRQTREDSTDTYICSLSDYIHATEFLVLLDYFATTY
jgi:hypothetical protein